MTQSDTNILDRKLKGLNLRAIFSMMVIAGSVLGFAFRHYANIMDKLNRIETNIQVILVNQAFQQKTIDRHEQALTSKQ